MKHLRKLLFAALSLAAFPVHAQLVTTDPGIPVATQAVTITFDASEGNQALMGFAGPIYAHTGVITSESTSPSDWKYVIAEWAENIPAAQLTNVGEDLWELEISPSIQEFYGVPDGEAIERIALVFRNATGTLVAKTAEEGDIFIDVFGEGLNISLVAPQGTALLEAGDLLDISASASDGATSMTLYVDDEQVTTATGNSLEHSLNTTGYDNGMHSIRVVASDGANQVEATGAFYLRGAVPVAELPAGMIPGINYIDANTVTLVLEDPSMMKQFVFAIGDFNDWQPTDDGYMNRSANGRYYWITLDVTPGMEYAYQYWIDGELRIADGYCEKVLDPWNDPWIPAEVYPNLKPYPVGKTQGIVSVFQTNRPEYDWQDTGFERPAEGDLVIYELHFRDFTLDDEIGTIQSAMPYLDYLQTLGINAVELMPVNEFEGNDSWGYNPSFYFCMDKAYGTRDDLKEFIQACHSRGMAVIIDMVLNHSFAQSPFAQMYWDPNNGEWGGPSEHNPWYNTGCPHEPWCWGSDFNHQSTHTQELTDRILRYWIEEYHVDGFRFDFTKGFTNTVSEGWAYDQSRVNLLQRMYNEVREYDQTAYMILEHLTDNSEEIALSNIGMMTWGNMNHAYNEATMGWNATSDISWASYTQRGWSHPRLVAYMESHDEERLMYKNLAYGNSNGDYDIQQLGTALDRVALGAAFFLTLPGPKMIWQFGELGYDYSIDYNGRVGRKPVRWDYASDPDRRDLYEAFAHLAHLKHTYDVFGTSDYDINLGNFAMKRINLYSNTEDVSIIGNFGVTEGPIDAFFSRTGWWYEYFSGDSINVVDLNTADDIVLAPGEYRIYSSRKFERPEISSPVGVAPVAAEGQDEILVYPNPSSGTFNFRFNLAQPSDATIEVFNMQGQLVKMVRENGLGQGEHRLIWNGTDMAGSMAPAGVYFYRVRAGQQVFTGRMVRVF